MKLKIIPNPNAEMYNIVTKAVEDKNGYCPCMIDENQDTKCMCKEFKEQVSEGACHCGRFIKIKI